MCYYNVITQLQYSTFCSEPFSCTGSAQVVHAYMWCDMVVLNAMSGLRFALFENLLGMYCYMLQNVDLC